MTFSAFDGTKKETKTSRHYRSVTCIPAAATCLPTDGKESETVHSSIALKCLLLLGTFRSGLGVGWVCVCVFPQNIFRMRV